MDYAIETEDLTKRYDDYNAVDDLGIKVHEGKVYGFLGRNGSGKTTTIRMIMGLIKPDNGYVNVLGRRISRNSGEYLSEIGAIIETPGFYGNLSAYENLEITAKLYKTDVENIYKSLEIVGLFGNDNYNLENKTVSKFSLGMKQRLAIANALIHSPQILILDEPTNGLDPAGIMVMRKLIRKLSESMGKTIFVSSHLLSEVQQIADYIGIIDKGKLIMEDKIDKFNSSDQSLLILETDDIEKTVDLIDPLNFEYVRNSDTIKIYCGRDDNVIINRVLVENSVNVYNLESVSKTLEERFLGITDSEVVS